MPPCDHAFQQLGLPADTDAFDILLQGAYADPSQAAVIDAADPAALRANYEAFSRGRALHTGETLDWFGRAASTAGRSP